LLCRPRGAGRSVLQPWQTMLNAGRGESPAFIPTCVEPPVDQLGNDSVCRETGSELAPQSRESTVAAAPPAVIGSADQIVKRGRVSPESELWSRRRCSTLSFQGPWPIRVAGCLWTSKFPIHPRFCISSEPAVELPSCPVLLHLPGHRGTGGLPIFRTGPMEPSGLSPATARIHPAGPCRRSAGTVSAPFRAVGGFGNDQREATPAEAMFQR
jgi:hypothetical protein